jgi:hypothetical protein
MLFIFPADMTFASVKKDSVYYYVKIDTSGVDLGYLRVDTLGTTLSVDDVRGDFAMWKIIWEIPEGGNQYTFVNKNWDTLRFEPVVRPQLDTIAAIRPDGICKIWSDLVFNEDSRNLFKTSYPGALGEDFFYLTMDREGAVMFSSETSENTQLYFSVERVQELPDTTKYYRLKVDTAGIPNVLPVGFLSADTLIRTDSLAVSDTLRGDLSLWKFAIDTMVYDTTFFKLINKGTDSILAFDIPERDTVAYLKKEGVLNQWRIPFFVEENGVGRFMVRDTVAHKDYYLGLQDTIVMLVSDTTEYKCMKFVFEEDGFVPDSSIVDTTKVYKVKYVKGLYAGKYLGANVLGNDSILLDTVYAHLPDGQFVVDRNNKFTLISRAGNVTTGRGFNRTDSLFVVYDDGGVAIPYQYTTQEAYDDGRRDTFEIVPIDYGHIKTEKYRRDLGYKYLQSGELSSSSYVFSFTSTSAETDSLNGLVIGYDETDSLVILLAADDTIRFVLEEVTGTHFPGAPAIADIPALERIAYRLRSTEDSTLYFSIQADSLAMDTISNPSSFFLKEDTMPGRGYYFIEDNNPVRKLLADSTKHFNLVKMDSIETHLFVLIPKDRYIAEEDSYDYLTRLPYGRGLYELTVDGESRYLAKNYYHYAVLGKEGESMLRSGSYAPADFHLWIDTARGPGYNPAKPSFYIVSEVDTASSRIAQPLDVSGYFLHVMDSMSLPERDDYIVEIEGRKYSRVNFVKAYRCSADELLLDTTSRAQFRDSIGFAGKNEHAINEYRFYLQCVDEDEGRYYIVTEQGYGGKNGIRGYLSIHPMNRKLYVGPRDGASLIPVTVSKASMVANEVLPPVVEEVTKKVTVIGGNGRVDIRNATGEHVVIYNVVGQQVVDRVIAADSETIPVSRGVLIVKVGEKMTRKVIVR